MRGKTVMWIAGLGFGGAVVVFAVAVVDAMVVDTASQVVVTAETPADVAAPVAYPAVAPAGSYAGSPAGSPAGSYAGSPAGSYVGSYVGEARDPASAPGGRSAPGVESWVTPTASATLRRGELQRAVSQDPFQPNRRAPAQRYVLPNQRRVVAEEEDEEIEAPDFRVVGAARIGAGGVALVQVDRGDVPRAVSVGESIEGYVLASVTEEGATWTGGGGNSVVPIVRPRAERRSNNNRNSRGNSERELQQRVQDLQGQMLEMIRGGGGGGQGRGVFRLNLDGLRIGFEMPGGAGGRGGRGGGRGGAP